MSANILLKAKGVRQITRGEFTSFSKPVNTLSYTSIGNKEIMDTVLEQLDKNGFNVKSEFYKCDKSNQKFVGGLTLTGGNTESDIFLGLKNSYDKSMTAAYALGSQIIICSNSVVRGQESLIRKHTGDAWNIVKNGISEGIKHLGNNFMMVQEELQKMKEIEVTKTIAASLIGRLYLEEEVISAHQLSIIKKEFNNESYNYGVKDSLFNIYQAVTHALKTSHPTQYLNDHLDAHTFFLNQAGIIVSKKNIPVGETIFHNQMSIYDVIPPEEEAMTVINGTPVEEQSMY